MVPWLPWSAGMRLERTSADGCGLALITSGGGGGNTIMLGNTASCHTIIGCGRMVVWLFTMLATPKYIVCESYDCNFLNSTVCTIQWLFWTMVISVQKNVVAERKF